MNKFIFAQLPLLFLHVACGQYPPDFEPLDGVDTATVGGTNSDTDMATDTGSETNTSLSTDTDSDTGGDTDSALPMDTETDASNPAIAWIVMSEGRFQMGSELETDEQPVHPVDLSGYEITETEVTVAQYRRCVNAGACGAPGSWSEKCYFHKDGYESYPVNCVDWNEAAAFCEWAGGRLPSEAEWEYAARSMGRDITFPWGDESATCGYVVMNDGGSGCGADLSFEVCSKQAGNTQQGLCDMSGNVWEWVQDVYHSSYKGAPDDGTAWEKGNNPNVRLVRGGGYLDGWRKLRAAARGLRFEKTYENTFLGFRCVQSMR